MPDCDVVAVLPARDEALSIGRVVAEIKALRAADESPVFSKIIVCDNASVDNTALIARAAGAEVISEPKPGYGSACLAALGLVDNADIIVFIDADNSVKIDQTHDLLSAIHAGADLAIGCRRFEQREPGSMTLAQVFGNWLASRLIRLIWKESVTDLGPFRAIRGEVLQRLKMQDQGYGWTVEMQVKAIQHRFCLTEVPVDYRCRVGRSKISGTIRGTIGAGFGIISMILKLALNPPLNISTRSAE